MSNMSSPEYNPRNGSQWIDSRSPENESKQELFAAGGGSQLLSEESVQPDFMGRLWLKEHPLNSQDDFTTACKYGTFNAVLDKKVGGYVLKGCNKQALKVGLHDGLHVVRICGNPIVNTKTTTQEEVDTAMENAAHGLWLTLRPVPVEEKRPKMLTKDWRTNPDWLAKSCDLTVTGAGPDAHAVMEERKCFQQLEEHVARQVVQPDTGKSSGKQLKLPSDWNRNSLEDILGNLPLNNGATEEKVISVLPGIMLENPPGQQSEFCIGPSFLVLTNMIVEGKASVDRLFVITQANYAKKLAIKESHDVSINVDGYATVTDKTNGLVTEYPEAYADWVMGEYNVQCNTSDSVNVMVCDMQILAARSTGRKSIQTVLKRVRHLVKSEPSDGVNNAVGCICITCAKTCCCKPLKCCKLAISCVVCKIPCSIGRCFKRFLTCDWFGYICGCAAEDVNASINGWHKKIEGTMSGQGDEERELLFTGDAVSIEQDILEPTAAKTKDENEEWSVTRDERKLAQSVLETVMVENKIDIAFKPDLFSDDAEIFSFYLHPGTAPTRSLEFLAMLSRSLATTKLRTNTEDFELGQTPFADLDYDDEPKGGFFGDGKKRKMKLSKKAYKTKSSCFCLGVLNLRKILLLLLVLVILAGAGAGVALATKKKKKK